MSTHVVYLSAVLGLLGIIVVQQCKIDKATDDAASTERRLLELQNIAVAHNGKPKDLAKKVSKKLRAKSGAVTAATSARPQSLMIASANSAVAGDAECAVKKDDTVKLEVEELRLKTNAGNTFVIGEINARVLREATPFASAQFTAETASLTIANPPEFAEKNGLFVGASAYFDGDFGGIGFVGYKLGGVRLHIGVGGSRNGTIGLMGVSLDLF